MNDRLVLAGMAMHAMLSWKGEWEIDLNTGQLTGDDRRLLSTASADIADSILERMNDPQTQRHER